MAEYVDKQKLLEEIKGLPNWVDVDNYLCYNCEDVHGLIEDMQSIEIVPCAECAHAKVVSEYDENSGCTVFMMQCDVCDMMIFQDQLDSWCCNGVKRDGNESS